MTYTVRFWNDVTKEIPAVMVFDTPRFTKRQYDIIVSQLFMLAAENIDNRSLFADVYEGSESNLPPVVGTLGVITIACETFVDGSTIDAHIFCNSVHVRKMNIAS